MDRLFRVDFYPQDWIIDTARLSPEDRGIFIQIVMMIYSNRGPIPNDEKHLANICNCSTRLVRASIKRLADQDFIQISGENIGQKRAENELNSKRNHLESSSNGGRTSAENRRKSLNNNELDFSDTIKPLGTSTPSPTPKAKDIDKPLPLSAPQIHNPVPRETGGFKKPDSGGVRGPEYAGIFKIALLIDGDGVARARENAPNCDLHELMQIYDKNINSGKMERPKNPSAAFPEWCKAYDDGVKRNKFKQETQP